MKTVLSVFVLLIVSTLARAQSSPLTPPALNSPSKPDNKAGAALRVGDKAPDFALPNGDGKLVTLSEYTAKTPVVMVFYRGFW